MRAACGTQPLAQLPAAPWPPPSPSPHQRPSIGCPGCQAAAASSRRTADAWAGNTSSGTPPTGPELTLPKPGCTYTASGSQNITADRYSPKPREPSPSASASRNFPSKPAVGKERRSTAHLSSEYEMEPSPSQSLVRNYASSASKSWSFSCWAKGGPSFCQACFLALAAAFLDFTC
jgi:hypothetical protein